MKTADRPVEGEEREAVSRDRSAATPARRMSQNEDQSPPTSSVTSANGAPLMMEVAIRCTVAACPCECFIPGKMQLRRCQTCAHDWVPHALDKLGCRNPPSPDSRTEAVQPNRVFDLASLVLYGCQALPIRLKILLDRLFAVLKPDEVVQVLHGFGWTHEDYSRGYILQDPSGHVLEKWSMCSREEEPLVLQQFLRFVETKALAQHLLAQDPPDRVESANTRNSTIDSDIKKFIDRASRSSSTSNNNNNSSTNNNNNNEVSGSRSSSSSGRARSQSPPPATSSSAPTTPTPTPTTSASETIAPTTSAVNHFSHSILNAPFNLARLHAAGAMPPLVPPNGPLPMPSAVSPLSLSPLNRLQSMHSLHFRKDRISPDDHHHHPHIPSHPLPLTSLTSSIPHSSGFMPLPALGSLPPMHHSEKSDLGSASDGGSDDESSPMALNLSRDRPKEREKERGRERERDRDLKDRDLDDYRERAMSSGMDGFNDKKKHMRKASTPMKRSWTPINLGTQLINPQTGKKRVQCNVCLKTFCDKGALKIHFSAVHLREMHKCTVEGCNMMFSSRRSRNRHSANPNPKLHSPHLRRKISPHDGRSSSAHPSHPLLLPQSMNLPLNPITGAPMSFSPMSSLPMTLLTPPPDMSRHPDNKHGLDLSVKYDDGDKRLDLSVHSTTTTSSDDMLDHRDGGNDLDGNQAKRARMSDSDPDDDETSLPDSNDCDDSLSIDNQSIKEDYMEHTSKVRKRKSLNPTRCAIPLADDDDISSDDSSNDIYPDERRCSPKEAFEDRLKERQRKMEKMAEYEAKIAATEIKTSIVPSLMDRLKKERHERAERSERNEEKHDTANDIKSEKMEVDDKEEDHEGRSANGSVNHDEAIDSENALRHLESLSQGHFGDLMSRSLVGQPGLLPSHLQFPLGMMGSYMSQGSPPGHDRDGSDRSGSNPESPCPDSSQQGCSSHFSMRDTSMMGNLDVPIDKENPRRCTACGKIFQNHFGVKTHYQNVHLKLMHKCTVEGCNAAFPSKRSRDRHSANLNLHRKLLSTSSDKSSIFLEKNHLSSLAANHSLHSDFLARLYADPHAIPLSLEAYKNHLPPNLADQMLVNGDRLPPVTLPTSLPPPPLLIPTLGVNSLALNSFGLGHFGSLNGTSHPLVDERESEHEERNRSRPSSPASSTSSVVFRVDDDVPTPESDGRYPCKLCHKTLEDSVELQRHYEKLHLPEMFRCTEPGCNKVFTSQKKRNYHVQNDSAHSKLKSRGLPLTPVTPTQTPTSPEGS